MRRGSFQQQRDDLRRIVPIRNANGQLHSLLPAGDGAVRHLFGDELAVRDDELGLVVESYDAGTNADAPNDSCLIPHFDHIAHLHRPLEKKNQAGKEIIEDVLQTEADADTECTGQDSDLRHVGAECGDCDVESNQQHDVVHEGRDGVG